MNNTVSTCEAGWKVRVKFLESSCASKFLWGSTLALNFWFFRQSVRHASGPSSGPLQVAINVAGTTVKITAKSA